MSPEQEVELKERVRDYEVSRYKRNAMFNLIYDFILAPASAKLIEDTNRMHWTNKTHDDHGNYCNLTLDVEKENKSGFWYNIGKAINDRTQVVNIWLNEQVFICEYYKYQYFPLCDKFKEEYDLHLKSVILRDFIIMDRCKK